MFGSHSGGARFEFRPGNGYPNNSLVFFGTFRRICHDQFLPHLPRFIIQTHLVFYSTVRNIRNVYSIIKLRGGHFPSNATYILTVVTASKSNRRKLWGWAKSLGHTRIFRWCCFSPRLYLLPCRFRGHIYSFQVAYAHSKRWLLQLESVPPRTWVTGDRWHWCSSVGLSCAYEGGCCLLSTLKVTEISTVEPRF